MLLQRFVVVLGVLVVIPIEVVASLDLFSTMDYAREAIMKHSGINPMPSNFDRRAKSGSSLSSSTNIYSNKFLQAINEIERGIAEAKTSQKGSSNSQQKLRLLKTSIQEAVKKKMYHFARHQLGRAFSLIEKTTNSSNSKRRRRAATTSAGSAFIRNLKTSLPSSKFKDFFALNGGVTLAFAIDTTGSMADEIDAAKQIAIDVIKMQRNHQVDYILSPFGDPEMGPVTFRDSCQNASFVADIKNLKAKGGGDCPELTFTGIMNALDDAPESESPLYVFTDASAKDNSLVDSVINLALELKITINFFITGGPCKRGDNNFSKVAEATSGRVLRFQNAQEMIQMSNYIGKSLHGFNIITTGSEMRPKRKRRSAGSKSYTFPIDETVETMLVCFASDTRNDSPGVILKDPTGIVISSQKVALSTALVYEIPTPKVGRWSIEMPPSAGKYTFDVKSTSQGMIDFSYFFLVTIRRLRSKIEVFTSNPVIGKLNKLVITVFGADKIDRQTVTLELITKDNEHIRDLNLSLNDTQGNRYTATFAPPSRPFKLKIKGTTIYGSPFERISHHIIEPKSVLLGLFFCKTENTIRRGSTSLSVFRLYNAAHADKKLVIKVRDKKGFAQPIRRAIRRIRRGRMGYFSVRFRAPTNVAVGTVNTATVEVIVNNREEKLIETIQMNVID